MQEIIAVINKDKNYFLRLWTYLTKASKEILKYLKWATGKFGEVFFGQQRIADFAKCTRETANRLLNQLEKDGFIKRIITKRRTLSYEICDLVRDIDFRKESIAPEPVHKQSEKVDVTPNVTPNVTLVNIPTPPSRYRNDKESAVVDKHKKIVKRNVMTDKEKEIVRERFSRLYLYDERYQSMGGHVNPAALEKMMIYNSFEAMMGVAEAYIVEFKRKLRDCGRMIGNGEAWIQKSLMKGTWRNVLRIEANRQKAFGGLGKFGRFVKRMTSYFVEFMNGSRIELDTNPQIFDSHFEHNKRMNTGVY